MPRFTPDMAWFRANPETNFRLRDAQPGEVDELSTKMLPAGVKADCSFTVPAGHALRVLAIKLPLRRVARMLTLAEDRAPAGTALMAIALGDRLALD